MPIENIMYFVLGALASALLALIVMPAVWRRAVRLTKKRIEAATPITMAEFRADKDQLRAEYALSTRRLEMTIEQLRQTLAERLAEIARDQAIIETLTRGRDSETARAGGIEARETEALARIAGFETRAAEDAQRILALEDELAALSARNADLAETVRNGIPAGLDADGAALSGDYEVDVNTLLGALLGERERLSALETEARDLIDRLEAADRRDADSERVIADLRGAIARAEAAIVPVADLATTESRLTEADAQVETILVETGGSERNGRAGSLAGRLTLEERIEALRLSIASIETTIAASGDPARLDQIVLRDHLRTIARDVGRIVSGKDDVSDPGRDESLFDRVQRFAGTTEPSPRPISTLRPPPRVSDRAIAMAEIRNARGVSAP